MRTTLLGGALGLLAVLVADPAGVGAQSKSRWTVRFSQPEIEGPLRWNIDTDTVEKSWCLDVAVDRRARALTVREVYSSDVISESRNRTAFRCPAGSLPLHRHYADYAHDRGPSADDDVLARHRRFAAVIMYVHRGRGTHEYIVYDPARALLH